MQLLPPLLTALLLTSTTVHAAGGSFTISTIDEESGEPIPTRMVVLRPDGSEQVVRRAVPSGVGVVLDKTQELSLPEGAYQFQMIRGPEYRIISGQFSMERTSLDSTQVALPRMVDMRREDWWSGDVAVMAPERYVELLMASEDLHFAGRLPGAADVQIRLNPIEQKTEPEKAGSQPWKPTIVRDDMLATADGLVIIGIDPDAEAFSETEQSVVSSQAIRDARKAGAEAILVENPFAWDLPIWLASRQIDGVLIMGEWLRLDRSVATIRQGRKPDRPGFIGEQGPGRWAENIYWQLLEAGFQIAPLGGSGSGLKNHPVGYSRTYVIPDRGTDQPLTNYTEATEPPAPPSQQQWWDAALRGRSVVTNGPLLRPTLGGKYPGHTFTSQNGEVLELQVELKLSVRDPVDYLDVIHNGDVVYSARLDEFARDNGQIPPFRFSDSGWVQVRVVTEHQEHWRAAVSAPWYIEFNGQRRISAKAVAFFQAWLSDREAMLAKLPKDEIRRHAPYVLAARNFWKELAEQTTVP